jgi:hypothetical protein
LALIAAHIDVSRWDPSNALNVSANQPWIGIICRVMERYDRQFDFDTQNTGNRGGIHLGRTPASCASTSTVAVLANPAVDFLAPTQPNPTTTIVPDEATLRPIAHIGRDSTSGAFMLGHPDGKTCAPPTYEDVFILTAVRGPCTLSAFNQR